MTLKHPLIESDRLRLRLLTPNDLEHVLVYWQQNEKHLAPYGPKMPADFLTPEFWRTQIQRNIQEFEQDVSARMFLFEKTNPVPVGHISFGAILRNAAQFCYLGYGLAEDKQGRGYMTEILPLAIAYAFDELKLHRIMANYIPTNERSGKLLKRLGFTVEGYARDYLCLNGKWEDHILTSITNPHSL